jgi:DNA-directed RNA polymerase subunit RPC12/RpoP
LEDKKMICPYCSSIMEKGHIYGDRYRLKWLSAFKKPLLGIFIAGGENIGKSGFFGRPRVTAYKCGVCSKLTIDLLDQED